ncbi:MAG: hypothetical protein DMH00_04780 [Acidobacteria bacterium]|nr:MAG: hypothetical protein DMH00_04780 [Acidobacteriota bacterium]
MKRARVFSTSLTLLGTAAATLPLCVLAAHAVAGRETALSVLLGAGLAAFLAVASLTLATWSHDKSHPVFLSVLVGGFLGRLAIFGSGIALLISLTHLPVAAFVAGLFAYYVLLQVLEIRALQKMFGSRSVGPTQRGV